MALCFSTFCESIVEIVIRLFFFVFLKRSMLHSFEKNCEVVRGLQFYVKNIIDCVEKMLEYFNHIFYPRKGSSVVFTENLRSASQL